MIITNAVLNGKIVTIETAENKILSVEDGVVSNADIDAGGLKVIPGFIDVHTHGRLGHDTMDAQLEEICADQAKHGTTSFLPTTLTMSFDEIKRATEAKYPSTGAQVIGFHLEGPYINPKYKGAQNEEYIVEPNTESFDEFKNVKMVTLAPEMPGCIEMIAYLKEKGIVPVIGHTDCDYETAMRAIDAGANCLTHIYNAMAPFHHRRPGPIGAAFERRCYAQLICDGFHISKPVVLATYKMFGPDRVVLISDSVRPAGLPDGESESCGLHVTIKDGQILLDDGTIAGSSACLHDCVKKAIEFGIPFDDAVRMATATPAEMLGVKKGAIKPGYDADLLLADDNLEIHKVIIAGKIFS